MAWRVSQDPCWSGDGTSKLCLYMHVYTASIDVYSLDVCTDAFMHITAYHTHNMGLFSIIATRVPPSCCLPGLGVDWPESGDDANAAVDPQIFCSIVAWHQWVQTNLGKFDHDFTATEPWNHWFDKGNHPLLWPSFRLVNYYNLPRHKSIEATSWQTASCEVV